MLRQSVLILLFFAGTQGPALASGAFLPAQDEFVRDDGEPENFLFDLDTGRLWTPPAALRRADPSEFLRWVRANGIDLLGETAPSIRGLVGFDMVAVPADAELWEATDGARVREVLAWAEVGTPVALSGRGELPATFIVRTREGSAGVLQITRLIDQPPRGARIRYKLLAPEPFPPSVPSEATAVVVGEATRAPEPVAAATGEETPETILQAARARLDRASAEYLQARTRFEEGALSFSGLLAAAEAASEATLRLEEARLELVRARGGDIEAGKRSLRRARLLALESRVLLLSEEYEREKRRMEEGKLTAEELAPLEKSLETARLRLSMMREN